MLINTALMSEIFQISLWNFAKLSIMNVMFFYWIPQYIFPQYFIKNRLDKVIFNIIYMLSFILLVIPGLVYLHIFSLPLFLLLLILFKAVTLRYFEKRNFLNEVIHIFRLLLIKTLDYIDNFEKGSKRHSKKLPTKYIEKIQNIFSPEYLLQVLVFAVFIYILYIINLGGFISFSDPVPDTAQFVEWIHSLHENILFKDGKTPGADFYGQATIIFFFQVISGIDSIVLFNIYPIFLVFFVLLGLFYIVYRITDSVYSSLFSVVLFGIVFLSPFGNNILGYLYQTDVPNIIHWNGFNVYFSWYEDVINVSPFAGVPIIHIPYERYSAGLAYELASSMFFLNNYFIAKSFETKDKGYITLYGLTLFLVFTFHGGGAIYLVVSNTFILILAILYRQLDWITFKRGLWVILLASVFGNLWMLSVIKYGIPQDFGAAAPFLDSLFATKESVKNVTDGGETLSMILSTKLQISIVIAMLVLPIIVLFVKRKFFPLSMTLIIVAVILVYFASNLGLPRAAKQTRAAEYLLSVFAMGGGIYFSIFIAKPLSYFKRKSYRYLALFISSIMILITMVQTPRWIDTKHFMKRTNSIEYSDLAYVLYKISQENQPFSWTAISYVQSYPKILGKGYHVNTPDFLLKYDPVKSFLEIQSNSVYIFIENSANKYAGTGEWYFRWRPQVQEQLKQWINLYSNTHDNLSIYYQNSIVTVYKIDNSEYVKYENERLKELRKRSNNGVY